MNISIYWSRCAVTCVTASLLSSGALILAPATAQAHSELVGSTPAANATLQEAPDKVSLEFNDDVQQQGGAITVTGPDGASFEVNSTFTASGTEATVDVRDITENGRFTVAYRVVSADGHVVQGDYAFRFQGISSNNPSPTLSEGPSPTDAATLSTSPAAQDEGGGGGSVIWVLGLGAIGLALIAAMVAVFTRRGRG